MGIEKLTGSLIGEANREAKEIVKTAEWHLEQMLKDEKSKEEGLKQRATQEVNSRLADQRNERLAWARLEAKRMIAEAREDAISSNLEDFFSVLKEVRKSSAYKSFLEKSVRMAVEELGGKTVVRCIKSDTPILGKLANVKLESDLEGLGGAIVEKEDGTVRIDLRIETLYDIKRDSMRKDVYDKIFTKDK